MSETMPNAPMPKAEAQQVSAGTAQRRGSLPKRIFGWILFCAGLLGASDVAIPQLNGLVYPHTALYLGIFAVFTLVWLGLARPRTNRWHQAIALGLGLLCFLLPFVGVPTGNDPFDMFTHLSGVRIMEGRRGFPAASAMVYAGPIVISAAICLAIAILLCLFGSKKRAALISAWAGLAAVVFTFTSMVPWHVTEFNLEAKYNEPALVAFQYDIGFYLSLAFSITGTVIAFKVSARFTQQSARLPVATVAAQG